MIINDPENAYVPLKWTECVNSTYTDFKKLFNIYGGYGGIQVIGHKNLYLLKDLLSNVSLRRLKEDVLDLPPKVYIEEFVELSSEQKKLYENVSDGIMCELDLLDHVPSVIEEIAINTRLRQITSFPGMISSDVTDSAKLDRMCELVEEIVSQGDKVLVLSSFKGAVLEASKRLKEYNPVICTGDTPDFMIEQNKKDFDEIKNCYVMCATWQKMGTGHTLSSANYVIFIDTPWTYADFEQASDRIYRIGQNKSVFIITLIAKDTYDERVQEILNTKKEISGYIVDDKFMDKFLSE